MVFIIARIANTAKIYIAGTDNAAIRLFTTAANKTNIVSFNAPNYPYNKEYFKITWRNLRRNKNFSVIKIPEFYFKLSEYNPFFKPYH